MTERKKAAASPQPRAKSDKKTKPVGDYARAHVGALTFTSPGAMDADE